MKKVTDIPQDERPREKLAKKGPQLYLNKSD